MLNITAISVTAKQSLNLTVQELKKKKKNLKDHLSVAAVALKWDQGHVSCNEKIKHKAKEMVSNKL